MEGRGVSSTSTCVSDTSSSPNAGEEGDSEEKEGSENKEGSGEEGFGEEDSEETAIDITEKMIDWYIAELQFKAKSLSTKQGARVCLQWQRRKIGFRHPPSLQTALQGAVAPLEDVPYRFKDWHPGSNDLDLDLVDPGLFPLAYGRSRIVTKGVTTLDDCIERCGEGDSKMVPMMVTRSFGRDFDRQLYCDKFQWLPCEVDISASGSNSVRITSYINNLHPNRHLKQYGVIEQTIARAIPLWNMTLSTLKLGVDRCRRIVYDRVKYDPDPGPGDDS